MKRLLISILVLLSAAMIPGYAQDAVSSFSSADATRMYQKLNLLKQSFAASSAQEYAAAVREAFDKDENGLTYFDFEIDIPDPINIVKLIKYGLKVGSQCFPKYTKVKSYKPDLNYARPKIVFEYHFTKGKATFHAYFDSFELRTSDRKTVITGIPAVGGEDYTIFLPPELYAKLYTDSVEYVVFGLYYGVTMLNEQYSQMDD